jgi:hypothetical protein
LGSIGWSVHIASLININQTTLRDQSTSRIQNNNNNNNNNAQLCYRHIHELPRTGNDAYHNQHQVQQEEEGREEATYEEVCRSRRNKSLKAEVPLGLPPRSFEQTAASHSDNTK